jgi:hypothetical protein
VNIVRIRHYIQLLGRKRSERSRFKASQSISKKKKKKRKRIWCGAHPYSQLPRRHR